MTIARQDYAFPFQIDTASQQTAQAGYSAHVDQMIRQLLLTDPGERVDLPQFGCGLRSLVFAPELGRAGGYSSAACHPGPEPVAGRHRERGRRHGGRRAARPSRRHT